MCHVAWGIRPLTGSSISTCKAAGELRTNVELAYMVLKASSETKRRVLSHELPAAIIITSPCQFPLNPGVVRGAAQHGPIDCIKLVFAGQFGIEIHLGGSCFEKQFLEQRYSQWSPND